MAAQPMTVNKLKILDPMTFPREISLLPLKAAVMLTAASGALVPMETRVSPMTMDGIFKAFAMEEEPSTKKSAPLIKKSIPIINKNIFRNMSHMFLTPTHKLCYIYLLI